FDQTRQPIVLENGEFARHRAALERTAPTIFTAVAELYARLAEAESAMERRGPANSLKDEDRAIVERWEGDARAAQRALREALGLKPLAGPRATVPVPLSTFIYDRTGEHLLYTLEDERRELVELGQVPEKMQQATISIEDKTFWSNPGIDVGGIVRAMQANSAAGTIRQGGST